MSAPLFNKRLVVAILSSRLSPSAGEGMRADPPPEKRHRKRSSLLDRSASLSI
jgi:hypothetical protein